MVIDGKAKLVDENLCDGLGACLDVCPRDAILREEKETETSVCCNGFPDLSILSAGRTPHSLLTNWPVQIALLPVHSPFLKGARLLVCADCVPFTFPDFHRRLLEGKKVCAGCPKLDDAGSYVNKLAAIFSQNDIIDIEVAYMEVPCCRGLVAITEEALKRSGKEIPVVLTRIGIDGRVKDE